MFIDAIPYSLQELDLFIDLSNLLPNLHLQLFLNVFLFLDQFFDETYFMLPVILVLRTHHTHCLVVSVAVVLQPFAVSGTEVIVRPLVVAIVQQFEHAMPVVLGHGEVHI